jgi:ketosteroid isomerase-like protein
MKSVLISGVLVLVATAMLTAGSDDAKIDEKKPVLDVEQALIDATLKHDLDALSNLLRDDYIDVDIEGHVHSAKDVAEIWQKVPPSTKEVDPKQRPNLTAIRVRIFGETALVTGGSTEQGPKGISTRYTRVWVKMSGQWRLASNQLTKVIPVKPCTTLKIQKLKIGMHTRPPAKY